MWSHFQAENQVQALVFKKYWGENVSLILTLGLGCLLLSWSTRFPLLFCAFHSPGWFGCGYSEGWPPQAGRWPWRQQPGLWTWGQGCWVQTHIHVWPSIYPSCYKVVPCSTDSCIRLPIVSSSSTKAMKIKVVNWGSLEIWTSAFLQLTKVSTAPVALKCQPEGEKKKKDYKFFFFKLVIG